MGWVSDHSRFLSPFLFLSSFALGLIIVHKSESEQVRGTIR